MGFDARQVDAMTAWELMAQFEGWRAANCPDGGGTAPTAEEHDALVEKYG